MEYPQLSAEGIIQLQPDIIIDISRCTSHQPCERIAKDWESLGEIEAVKNKMVFSLSGDYMTIPGPRVFLILKDFKKIFITYKTLAIQPQ
jgi:iron complex transport system substrate-binding protein